MNNIHSQLIEKEREKDTMLDEYKLFFHMRNNKNVLLTGGAGTGKTYVINKFIDIVGGFNREVEEDNQKNKTRNPFFKVARLATTGIAATHINGITLDSFFGLRGCNKMSELRRVDMKTAMINIHNHDCFCFDEVSMLRADKFEVIVYLFFYYWMQKIDQIRNTIFEIQSGFITVGPKEKKSVISKYDNEILFIEQNCTQEKGFWGKGVLFSGDFMQIPPVVTKKDEFVKVPDVDKWMKFNPWIFCCETWTKCNFETMLLTEVKRQDNKEFSKILNMIRLSRISMRADKMLKARNFKTYDDVLAHLKENNLSIPPVLCPTNNMVSGYNDAMVNSIDGEVESFKGSFNWNSYLPEEENKDLVFAALKDTLMEKEIFLKTDSRIMFLVNDKEGRFCNGSVGAYKYKAVAFDSSQKKYEDVEDFLMDFKEDHGIDFKVEHFDGKNVIRFDSDLMKKLRVAFVQWRDEHFVDGARKIKFHVINKLGEDGKELTKYGRPIVDDLDYVFGTKCLAVSVDRGREIVVNKDGSDSHYVEKKEMICLERAQYFYNEGRADNDGGFEEKYDILFSQFPIKLAYSVTFHKSQGMTMKSLIVDFNSKYVGPGAAYVALSRVERIEDLYLIGWHKNKVRACGDGIRFYLALETKMKHLAELEERERVEAIQVAQDAIVESGVEGEV